MFTSCLGCLSRVRPVRRPRGTGAGRPVTGHRATLRSWRPPWTRILARSRWSTRARIVVATAMCPAVLRLRCHRFRTRSGTPRHRRGGCETVRA